jgi:hypothetical protein
MLTTSIRYSADGYRLVVTDVPLWAVVAESVAETACAWLGHPLCRGTSPLAFQLGQRLLSPASRREQGRWSTPISDDQVRETFPESVVDLDE